MHIEENQDEMRARQNGTGRAAAAGHTNARGTFEQRVAMMNMTMPAREDAHVAGKPVFPLNVEDGQGGEAAVNIGTMRALLGTLGLADMRRLINYLMLQDKLTRREAYEGYRFMKEDSGGEEILLHELLKEPLETLILAYAVAGRLRNSAGRNRRGSSARQLESDDVGSLDRALVGDRGFGRAVRNDPTKMLRPRLGLDDAAAYIARPRRRLVHPEQALSGGKRGRQATPVLWDGGAEERDPIALCGADARRFLARTAHETSRNPLLRAHAVQRSQLARLMRGSCTFDGADAEALLDRTLRAGKTTTPFAGLDPVSREELLADGIPPEQLVPLGLDA